MYKIAYYYFLFLFYFIFCVGEKTLLSKYGEL